MWLEATVAAVLANSNLHAGYCSCHPHITVKALTGIQKWPVLIISIFTTELLLEGVLCFHEGKILLK